MDSEKHKELTGVLNDTVLKNVKKLSTRNVNLIICIYAFKALHAYSIKNFKKVSTYIQKLGEVAEKHKN